ncbi:glycoside hydrolase family 6 protein [Microbacterium sp. X-17]|uniref:glycoside hydrolase family 6 protein n=1 Tax=Microbacterium sp. X-17 TaxID=3144404 RepID=UPI0031F589EB
MTALSAPPQRSPRRRRRLPAWAIVTIVVAGLLACIAALGVVGWIASQALLALGASPPGVGTRIVAPDESKAAQAAASGTGTPGEHDAAAYLAAQPTAYWLTPELDGIDEVQDRVLHLESEARTQSASLAIVVYGLPGRDCGNHSAGGLDEPAYQQWTQKIGDALRTAGDVRKIVVLEPDSLALAPQCGNVDERVSELRDAIERLASINTWIYLDGGHSDWLPPDQMASLIAQVGERDKIRGFATNVSNYQWSYNEFAYAHKVSDALGGSHAIVDSSRNGAGPTGDWCNPPGRLVGEAGGTYGDDVVDTNLWIKPPGESDGACNGGPPAGEWWATGAVGLTREVDPGAAK